MREFALRYPEAYEEFPWGHSAIKVKGKIFVALSHDENGWSFSVKLPVSGAVALMLPFAKPTEYGLGKSGWVTASIAHDDKPPVALFRSWVDESYRAIAPKRLVAQLLSRNDSHRKRPTVRAIGTKRSLQRKRTRT